MTNRPTSVREAPAAGRPAIPDEHAAGVAPNAGAPRGLHGPSTSHASVTEERQDQRRWLVRLRFNQERLISGLVRRRPVPTKLWATEAGTEYLVQLGGRLFLVDIRQRLLFQLPFDTVDTDERDLELLLPYPVPVVDDLQDGLAGPVQLREPEVGAGVIVVPASGEIASQLSSPDGIDMLPPIREFREVYLVHFRAGDLIVDVILPPRTGS